MATTKKTAAKPAAKKATAKTAGKKAPAKKPAVKKTTAKKTTAKKTAAKKPAAKSTVKKTIAAKATAAKSAVKSAAKKAAVKTSAAKSAVKTKAKTIAVKTKAAVSAAKTAAKTTTVKPAEDIVKLRNLFEAYSQNKLPFAQGYIVSSFFSDSSAYSIFEIVSYAGVKEIYPAGEGLTFVTGGKKLYILVEPDTYHQKYEEPVSRSKSEGEYIPYRFNELETIISKNQTRIMIGKEPVEISGSFTILQPKGINFSIVFYEESPNVFNTLTSFFQTELNGRRIPEADAKKAAKFITGIIEKSMSAEAGIL